MLGGHGFAFSAGFDIAWMASQDAEAVAPGLPGIEAGWGWGTASGVLLRELVVEPK